MTNKLIIDGDVMLSNNLTPYQYMFLHALYYKEFKYLLGCVSKITIKKIRNTLINTPYILSVDTEGKVPDTIISKMNVEKLLGLHTDVINFDEWYQTYPIKVGSRVLRAVSDTSILYKKHKEKYKKKVKTLAQHTQAINATESFVSMQKQANKLQYLPNIETVLNNAYWENWEVFTEAKGVEGKSWNSSNI